MRWGYVIIIIRLAADMQSRPAAECSRDFSMLHGAIRRFGAALEGGVYGRTGIIHGLLSHSPRPAGETAGVKELSNSLTKAGFEKATLHDLYTVTA